jgi:AraC-like DNA-binding protein
VTDPISEVLRAVRLTGAFFFTVDASAPWVAEAPPARDLAPHLMPGLEHVIEYHVVASGSCWAGVLGGPATPLEAGDVIVFPQGDAHVVSSSPGMRGDPHVDPKELARSKLPLTVSLLGGGKERAQIICGFIGCDTRPFNPLMAALPRVIHMPGTHGRDSIARRLVDLAVAESSAPRAGTESVLSRLSELLFVEVVRFHLAGQAPEDVGWFAGLRDDSVGRALHRLHERPAHAWGLDELAKEAGMSRSMLAERFAHFVGVPPIQYLAQWRIQLAASLLRSSQSSLAEIAHRVGYGSEAALSRAFKRWVGVAPAPYRRGEVA